MWITIPLTLFFKVHCEVPRLPSELTFRSGAKICEKRSLSQAGARRVERLGDLEPLCEKLARGKQRGRGYRQQVSSTRSDPSFQIAERGVRDQIFRGYLPSITPSSAFYHLARRTNDFMGMRCSRKVSTDQQSSQHVPLRGEGMFAAGH